MCRCVLPGSLPPNTSLHPLFALTPSPSSSSSQVPCLLSRFSFSILFLLCHFQFLKASLCWMANGALLSGSERKKENETYKEMWRERGEMEKAIEGQRHQISLQIIKSSPPPYSTNSQQSSPHRSAMCLKYVGIHNRLPQRREPALSLMRGLCRSSRPIPAPQQICRINPEGSIKEKEKRRWDTNIYNENVDDRCITRKPCYLTEGPIM